MKLYVKNTTSGLVPMYDADYEEKRKLKVGKVYSVEVRLARNYRFHKKYFSLINCAWEYQREKTRAFFNEDIEGFRKCVEISAGWYDQIYSIERKEWIQIPKSISFGSMDEAAFSTFYDRVKDVLFQVFLKHITEDEFMQNLVNF